MFNMKHVKVSSEAMQLLVLILMELKIFERF